MHTLLSVPIPHITRNALDSLAHTLKRQSTRAAAIASSIAEMTEQIRAQAVRSRHDGVGIELENEHGRRLIYTDEFGARLAEGNGLLILNAQPSNTWLPTVMIRRVRDHYRVTTQSVRRQGKGLVQRIRTWWRWTPRRTEITQNFYLGPDRENIRGPEAGAVAGVRVLVIRGSLSRLSFRTLEWQPPLWTLLILAEQLELDNLPARRVCGRNMELEPEDAYTVIKQLHRGERRVEEMVDTLTGDLLPPLESIMETIRHDHPGAYQRLHADR